MGDLVDSIGLASRGSACERLHPGRRLFDEQDEYGIHTFLDPGLTHHLVERREIDWGRTPSGLSGRSSS